MNKLAVIVPFYKRHELTALCFKRLLSQSKRLGVDVIVCGSEGEDSKKIAKGLKYIERPNILGLKLNALMNECKDYDGVILLGSDDFISDSVIKMYQSIDVSKEVYYSFNDVYVYSARHNKIVSDLDYTRAGKGIGVARLFTKPTLEKMGYKVWTGTRKRAMDGDSQKRLELQGINEVLIPLEGHFIIDVKLENNLTSQDIVNTGHKEHNKGTLRHRLGKIGQDILNLKPTEPERIVFKIEKMSKTKGLVVKSFHQYEEGKTYEFKLANFKQLVKAGFVVESKDDVKKVGTGTPAKKKRIKKKWYK